MWNNVPGTDNDVLYLIKKQITKHTNCTFNFKLVYINILEIKLKTWKNKAPGVDFVDITMFTIVAKLIAGWLSVIL